MNNKIGQEKNQVINNNPIVKALSREEISRRIAEIQDSLKASTWKAPMPWWKKSTPEADTPPSQTPQEASQ